MKLALVLSMIIFSFSTFAKNIKWSDFYTGKTYTLNQSLNLADAKDAFTVKKGEVLKLDSSTALPMIKVQLLKFVLNSCPSNSMKTELELLEVPQTSNPTVVIGYDLDQDCTLEVFVEQKDIYAESIFN